MTALMEMMREVLMMSETTVKFDKPSIYKTCLEEGFAL